MNKNLIRPLETSCAKHSRPEEAVEANDVLADEVIKLGLGIVPHLQAPEILQGSDVADGSIHPDIEELVLIARNLETKVGSVARNAPPS